jgi:hypothetical protein
MQNKVSVRGKGDDNGKEDDGSGGGVTDQQTPIN